MKRKRLSAININTPYWKRVAKMVRRLVGWNPDKRKRQHRILAVKCPACGAWPGSKCRTGVTRKAMASHAERRELAKGVASEKAAV